MSDRARVAPALHGLVLAGGRSQRLGRDKALLLYEGSPLLERAENLLRKVLAQVSVSVRQDQADDDLRRRFLLITDRQEAIGPAAGILAAHRSYPGAAWLVLACDMPRVREQDLTALIAARDPSCGATAFRQPADRRPEPLCAIYEPATLARFQEQVDAGGNPSPRDWLAAVDVVLLDPRHSDVLASINTPEDLERLCGCQ